MSTDRITHDPAAEARDIARIPQRPYERQAPQRVTFAAITLSYRFVAGCYPAETTSYAALAEHLLHNGHGRMLYACNAVDMTGISIYPYDSIDLVAVAAMIRAADSTLAADYPLVRE